MATYIAGVTDYIPSLQPFQPDLNFYANVMQTRQSRYDAAKSQINNLYGSLLNSPLTREDSIKRREDFFKLINDDIKKISGLDLSLQQNTDAALGVFKGFYEDDLIMADLTTTRDFHNKLKKADNYKSCTDAEKCGGMYWEPGVKKLQYQMQDFKTMSAKDAVGFKLDDYDAYVPWKEKAMKLVMDKGYSVERDELNGDWIVHNENGELVQEGLYGLFKSVYGNDPRIEKNYRTLAEVNRQDFVYGNEKTYGSKEKAQEVYVNSIMQRGINSLNKNIKITTDAYDQLNNRQLELEKKMKTKALTADEQSTYDYIIEKKEQLGQTKKSLGERLDLINKNIEAKDIAALTEKADVASASALEEDELSSLAKTLAMRNSKRTFKANPFKEIEKRSAAEKSEMILQNTLDKDKMRFKFAIDKELARDKYNYDLSLKEFELGRKSGDIPDAEGVEIEGLPGSTYAEDLKENPQAVYQQNQQEVTQSEGATRNQTISYLYNIFQSAKNSASGNNGAAQYLMNTYGPNYKNIKSPTDLLVAINNKKNSGGYYSVFKNTVKTLDRSKNPTGDVSWASGFMNTSKRQAYEIEKNHEAYVAKMAMNLDANKRTVNKIRTSAGSDNKVAKYADLLITKNGVRYTGEKAPATFIADFIKRKEKEGDYNADIDDAQDAYEELQKQFDITYNTIPNTSITQGAGLSGSGMTSARAKSYSSINLTSGKGVGGDVYTTLNNAINNSGYSKVVIGNTSRDSYEQDTDASAQKIIEDILMSARSGNKKDAPLVGAVIAPVAGDSKNVSAIQIKLSQDIIDKYSKEKGDPFYGKKNELSKGITVFYNNQEINSPINRSIALSPTQQILLSGKRHSINTYSADAGTVEYVYNDATGKVRVKTSGKQIDKKTGTLFTAFEEDDLEIALDQVDIHEANVLDKLDLLSKRNRQEQINWSISNKTK